MSLLALHTAIAVANALVTAFQGGVTVADSTSVSARPAAPEQVVAGEQAAAAHATPVDLENRPSIGLGVSWPGFSIGAGYVPQLALRSAFDETDRSTLVLHTGYIGVTIGDGRLRGTLAASGSLGTQTFTRLTTTPIDPTRPVDPTVSRVDFIPPAQTIDVLTESFSAGIDYGWSPRFNTGISARYTVSGGRGDEAEALLPRQSGEGLSAFASFVASSTDQFGSSLGVNTANTSNGNEYTGMQLALSWGHRISPTTSSQLGLGVSGYRSVVGDLCSSDQMPQGPGMCTRTSTLYPAASGSLSTSLIRERDFTLAASLGASIAPTITALTGQLQQRVQGSATLNAVIAQHTNVTASVDSAQTIPRDEHEVRVIGLGVTVGHQVSKLVDLIAGYRTAWQQSRDPMLGSLPQQWSAFLGLTLRAPPLTF